MVTTSAELRRRVEALERGPRTQDTKIFFIEEGEDPALTQAQWEAVKAWKKANPWVHSHVIVYDEVGPR